MIITLIVSAILWALAFVLPLAALLWICYFLLTLPIRRQERARFFLELLDAGFRAGHNAEHQILSLAQSQDASMGVRFHWLAAWLRRGLRLGEALDKVPHFLPPRVTAMLKAGEQAGQLPAVIPACRHLLGDGVSQTRGGVNYLVVLVYGLTPVACAIVSITAIFVLPRFEQILAEMEIAMPPVTGWMLGQTGSIVWLLNGLFLGVLITATFYLGGPRLTTWLQNGIFPFSDWAAWQLPWKRKRLQRDFASMLATLLDSGMSEDRALLLAGESMANQAVTRNATRALADLKSGQPLTEAVRRLDRSGELHWRLCNASHTGHGFTEALGGWLEALDARAFQQEQAAGQLITTGIVMVHGVVIGVLVIGVFQILIAIIQEGLLW
jgi:type II secretory pathway component PulF